MQVCVSVFFVQLHTIVWSEPGMSEYVYACVSVCVLLLSRYSEMSNSQPPGLQWFCWIGQMVLSRRGVCVCECACMSARSVCVYLHVSFPDLTVLSLSFLRVHIVCVSTSASIGLWAHTHSLPPAPKTELILWWPCCDPDEHSWHIKPTFSQCACPCFHCLYACLKRPKSFLLCWRGNILEIITTRQIKKGWGVNNPPNSTSATRTVYVCVPVLL